jgi:potassium-transporting ATPase KdpC subunit
MRLLTRSLAFLGSMTVVLGMAYPALVTLVAQVAFPYQASGSLILLRGQVRGSRLLAQDSGSPRYFQPRPSASGYVTVGAGASNLGPLSVELKRQAAERDRAWRGRFGLPAPEEMRYASASGLDPDISLQAALDQLDSVALARGLGDSGREALRAEILGLADKGASPFSGRIVNVMDLNLELDADPRFAGEGRKP